MKQYLVRKSHLAGKVVVPPSKSQTLRAVLLGALGEGRSVIHGPLVSPDTRAMVDACRCFGAEIHEDSDSLEIEGVGGEVHCAGGTIDAGGSGLVLRLCSAVGALATSPLLVTGDGALCRQRPMQPLLDGLTQLGASARSVHGSGMAPVLIQGPLRGGRACISGEDSQYVSALLIAGALAPEPVELVVDNAGEKPWVSLTLHWLDRLGIPYDNDAFRRFRLPGGARHQGFDYTVPGDVSSAAFPLAAALITGSELNVSPIDIDDPQGDKALFDVFRAMGANIAYDKAQLTLHVGGGSHLKGVDVDINDCIDGITALAVVGCFAEGETVIRNAAVARQKECNRIRTLVNELSKMGANIAETADGLVVSGSALHGAKVDSHHDHRVAMALAVAGLGAQGETVISPVDCIVKTFPSFAQEMRSAGADIEATP